MARFIVHSADPACTQLVRTAFTPLAAVGCAASERGLGQALTGQPVLALVLDGAFADAPARCQRIRALTVVPIIAIARDQLGATRTLLLRAGADDVLAWPCAAIELRARVLVKLRRWTPTPSHRQPKVEW